MTFNNMAAFMPTDEIWAYVEIVPNNNFAHWARSSQVDMLCVLNTDYVNFIWMRSLVKKVNFVI